MQAFVEGRIRTEALPLFSRTHCLSLLKTADLPSMVAASNFARYGQLPEIRSRKFAVPNVTGVNGAKGAKGVRAKGVSVNCF